MSRRFTCALLTTTIFFCALAKENEYTATSEFVKKQLTEDKLLTNIVRARNSSKVTYLKDNGSETYDKSLDKEARTANHRLESESRDNCCGSRHGSSTSTRPDSYHDKILADIGRYSLKYGERLPLDRYGWQTQVQPPDWSGSSRRPGNGNYVGTTFYEGSQAGDRFGSRPSYGSESSRKPGGYDSAVSTGYGYGSGGYGGYGFSRPTGYGGSTGNGGYGISGTLANGDEFGPVEPNYPEGNAPPHPNIQAQKAVALKALAGVALIGAAAALATNPVLLPIGIVSGRRKRSNLSTKDEELYMDYILRALRTNSTKIYNSEDGNKMSISPTCIARVVCEIRKSYWSALRKDVDFFRENEDLERRLNNFISNNALNAKPVDIRIKQLIKAAIIVASDGGNCNTFTCTFVKSTEAKSYSIFKL